MNPVVLIPAYKPPPGFPALVREMAAAGFGAVVIVNDGSGAAYKPLFDAAALPGVNVLEHAQNRGKGAALRTGLEYIRRTWPDCPGVVTVDADGQHLTSDALTVARRLREHPDHLIIGARSFAGRIPWRSRLGNICTRFLFRYLTGVGVSDTQSGLRGIPRSLIPDLLKLASDRYQYELEMLLLCARNRRPITEETIATVYQDGNPTSHFNPLVDSIKIYYSLFRFTMVGLFSWILDYGLFVSLYFILNQRILAAHALARAVSMTFNYLTVKRYVYGSNAKHRLALTRYLTAALFSAGFSYGLIRLLVAYLGWHPAGAKLPAEALVFLINFALLREFVF